MIGLSFKTGTDDLRESPLVETAERLIGKGFKLKIYDPEVSLSRLMGANRRYIERTIPHVASLMCEHCEELLEESEIIIVGLRDEAVLEALYAGSRPEQIVVDLVDIPDPERIKGEYVGVCW